MIGYMILTALLAAAVTGLLFMGCELRDTRRALEQERARREQAQGCAEAFQATARKYEREERGLMRELQNLMRFDGSERGQEELDDGTE